VPLSREELIREAEARERALRDAVEKQVHYEYIYREREIEMIRIER
jgi:hypothetical protein